jgi:hypothetical protein
MSARYPMKFNRESFFPYLLTPFLLPVTDSALFFFFHISDPCYVQAGN